MAIDFDAATDSYNAPLEARIQLLSATSETEANNGIRRSTKEELINVHLNNIALLKRSSNPGLGKPIILPAAYSPSVLSLSELQKARPCFFYHIHAITKHRLSSKI